MLQELGEVRDDDVGAVLEQGLPLSGAVDSDNEAEVPGAPRLDSRQCVLEDGRFGRLDADLLRRREERVGRRLSVEVPLLDDDPVDADLEQVLDPGSLENVLAVRAGGHDGSVESRLSDRMDVPHRALVGLDAVALQERHHDLVLAVSETVDRLGRRRVVRIAVGQLDSARGQERADAVVAWLAVDVPVVVGERVEGDELLAGLLGALSQVRVEHLLPGGRVHLGGLGEDAVEIEEAGADPARQPKLLRVAGHEQTVQNKGQYETATRPRRRLRCRPGGRGGFAGATVLTRLASPKAVQYETATLGSPFRSPSRSRFRPPFSLTLGFRLRPSGSASSYLRSVLGARGNLGGLGSRHK